MLLGVEEIEIKKQSDKQTLKKQRAAYVKSLEKTSRIKYILLIFS